MDTHLAEDAARLLPLARQSQRRQNRRAKLGQYARTVLAAAVDPVFTGGGGLRALEDDLSGVLSDNDEGAVRECLRETGAAHAVLAYPDAR